MSKPKDDWVHQLYIQYAPDLYRIAKYRLQDPEAAYDLTQEVFLTLLDKGEAMKDHPNPGGWLMVTFRHKLGHEFDRRAARAQHEAPDQALAWLAAPRPAGRGDPGRGPPPAAEPAGQGAAKNGLRRGPELPGDEPPPERPPRPPAAPGSIGPGSGANTI